MFKLEMNQDTKTILMSEMPPCSLARIVKGPRDDIGHIVMRTAARNSFEVMDLSKSGPDMCWSNPASIEVELLPVGTSITLTVE